MAPLPNSSGLSPAAFAQSRMPGAVAASQSTAITPSQETAAGLAVPSVLDVQAAEVTLAEIRSDRLERDIGVLRREMSRLQTEKRSSDLELLESRRAARQVEHQLDKVKSTISFQLGSALIESKQSIRAAAELPQRLYYVFRSSQMLRDKHLRTRKTMNASIAQSAEAVGLVTAALAMIASKGRGPAIAWTRVQGAKPSVLAYALTEIARLAALDEPLLASTLGAEAIDLDPAEHRVKTLAFQLADLGHIRQAVALINKAVVAGAKFNNSEAKKADHLRALARLLELPPVVPAPSRHRAPETSRCVALVGRQSLPYHASTVALRLADRAQQLATEGWEVRVITPPGYPLDQRRRAALATQEGASHANENAFVRLEPTEHPEEVTDLYIPAAAERVAAAVRSMGATVIQADGYFVNGIVAAYAARLAGKPLVLEFDEFWDPHDPFTKGFERTEKGQMQLWMSLIAARAADRCVVSSAALVDVLTGAGVDRGRIVVMPHQVAAVPPDAAARAALARDLGLEKGPVIGVVRDLCESYDTAVLADLLAGLAAAHPSLKLLVVGHGRNGAGLRHRVAERRLGDRLVLIDQPVPSQMALYRSLLDVAVFTRIDTLKAAMVSAYEVSAAMAAGSAVVAYRTTDAAALIEDRVSGLLCAPGDADDLRRKVHTLLADGGLRKQLGAAAHHAHSALGPTSPDRPQLSDLYQQLIEPERRLAAAS